MLAVTAPIASGIQADTFLLHSLPGYSTRTDVKTIYLDFKGQITTGTRWNTQYNTPTIFTPVFDVDGDPTNFNAEWQIIQSVWEEVSELFRPFDIDVTTQDPTTSSPGALYDSGGQDANWGIRVLIGGSNNDWFVPNGGPASVAGQAYTSTFHSVGAELPAFIFQNQELVTDALGALDPVATAAAIGLGASFDAGVSLGLKADGQNRYYHNLTNGQTTTVHDTYFSGQALNSDASMFDPVGNPTWSPAAAWSAIMGANLPDVALAQWNKGDYYNANDGQNAVLDELAVITGGNNGVTYRADDHGNTIATADALGVAADTTNPAFDDLSADGVISQNTDKDVFSFTVEGLGGAVSLDITPFVNLATYVGPESLDIRANIYSSNGTLIATSNPLSDLAAGSGTVADTFYTNDPTTGLPVPTTTDPTGGWQVQLDMSAHTPTFTDATTGDIYGVVNLHPTGDLTDINNLNNSQVSQLILPAGTYYVSIEGGSRPLTYLDGTDEAFLMALGDPMLSKTNPLPTGSSIHPGPVERYNIPDTGIGYYDEKPDPKDPTGKTFIQIPKAAALPDDNSDYGYSNYGSLGYYSIKGTVSKNLVVGVDFDGPGGLSPTNWNQYTGGAPAELSGLINEAGNFVPYTLSVSSTGGNITTVKSTHAIDPTELPAHGIPLNNLDGYITTQTSSLNFTWNNLTPDTVYQVYVFGSSSQAAENQVTVTGGMWNGVQQTYSFTQFITPNSFITNNNAPGSQELSSYSLLVISDDTGHITINVAGADGLPAAVAGLAITTTKVGSIAGTKFNDANGNHTQDSGEAALPGWIIYLDLNNDGILNSTADENKVIPAPHVPQPITDATTLGGSVTKNQLDFPDSGTIDNLTVNLSISHTYDADLHVALVSPSGTIVQLFASVGSYGQNFTNVTFDDSAVIDIGQLPVSAAPFTGTWRPQANPTEIPGDPTVGAHTLSAFNGEDAKGTWTLLVLDDSTGDTGTLLNWSISVKTSGTFLEPYAITDANGKYSFTKLPAGQYYVREHFTDDQTAAGWKQSFAPAPVTVHSGAAVTGIDFGNWFPATQEGSISGQIFQDLDGDGVKDDNEPGVGGAIAYIDSNNNGVRDLPSTPTVLNSTDVPKPIKDFTTVNSQIEFNGLGTVFSVQVTLDITHSFVGDLDAFLISPSGRIVELFTGVGGQYNNFQNLTLDDSAPRSISTIGVNDVPYTGTWAPEGHLSDFNSDDAAGLWTLQIRDTQQFDEGTLNSWSLKISAGEEFRTADSDGNYSFESVPPGNYIIREEAPQGYTQIAPANPSIPASTWSTGQWLVSVLGLDDPNNTPVDSHRNVKNVNFANLAAQPLPGDFDRSGKVDMLDYLMWRHTLGTSVSSPFAGADGDGNGVVNAADYNIWRDNYGKVIDDFGNNAATANSTTSIPATKHGTIEVAGDVDWFAFPATAGQTYDITTTLGTLSDTVLRLIDTDGQTQIAQNDNANGLASEIHWTPTTDGTYYVEVRAAGSLTGTYTLGIQAAIDDHGNSASDATQIAAPTPAGGVTGEIETSTDQDWFKFSAVANSNYSIDVNLDTLVDSQLSLISSDGTTVLKFDDDSGPGYASHIDWTFATSGIYYLEVNGYGSDLGTYHVTVTVSGSGSGSSAFIEQPAEEAPSTAGGTSLAFSSVLGSALSFPTKAIQPALQPASGTNDSESALLAWVASQSTGGSSSQVAVDEFHASGDGHTGDDLADSFDSVFNSLGESAAKKTVAV